MTIVAQNVLETASRVDVEPILLGRQSDPEQDVLLTHVVRADRPARQRIRLRWEHASAALAESVLQHFRAQLGAFLFRLRNGTSLEVTYAEAPAFNPRTALAVDIDVVLEQALDTD